MKNYAFSLLLFTLFFGACQTNDNEKLSGLHIKFTNTTEFNISDLEVNEIPVGAISNGTSSDYIPFESITVMYENTPMINAESIVKGDTIFSYQHVFCGTPPLPPMEEFTDGMLEIEIISESADYLNFILVE